ncbi:hypothetical protein NL781_005060 [Salmonella enterica]|uniref:hypothetical protein n=1 Tax=Salmonella enterica TaxID=28901 RepID=UPI00102D9DA4|nr:hypothetical protein [Salmonella enterica]ECF6721444.1 hypothetical protein [Salmonella enterica subsp. enterica]EDC1984105.1 hypothetical protein [Salmonella enterica subsp. enterica serovar Muenchen]EEC1154758.1 hypothetical protein [Salmonella enterica subsp. enterica serovar Give]EAN9866262.1 hypothetical protein [Salmonella enterica]EAQ9150248.1 hypothetical protein [Salmonella enterica]
MSIEKKQHDTQAIAFEFVTNAENSMCSILQAKSVASLWLESMGSLKNDSIEKHLLSNIISTLSKAEKDVSLSINFDMNKLDDITVDSLDSSDYAGERLSHVVERELDTAEYVIDNNKVVKNRVVQMDSPKGSAKLPVFKGLSLVPLDALKNISAIIETGHLMTSCSDKECEEIGDVIIDFARQYAASAHAYAQEEKK